MVTLWGVSISYCLCSILCFKIYLRRISYSINLNVWKNFAVNISGPGFLGEESFILWFYFPHLLKVCLGCWFFFLGLIFLWIWGAYWKPVLLLDCLAPPYVKGGPWSCFILMHHVQGLWRPVPFWMKLEEE